MAEDGVRSERPLPVVADDGVKRGGVMSDSGAKEGEGSTEEASGLRDGADGERDGPKAAGPGAGSGELLH